MLDAGPVLAIVLGLLLVVALPIASLVMLFALHGRISALEEALRRCESILNGLKGQKQSASTHEEPAPKAAAAPAPAVPASTPKPAEPLVPPKPKVAEAFSAEPAPAKPAFEEPRAKAEGQAKKPAPEFQAVEPAAERPASESGFERSAADALKRVWSWILVGEERKGVSLEYAVATTWLVRGAIVIILAAIAFGVNYSIKNGALGPEARVALCFLAGVAMTCFGLWLAKGKYRPAGQGLAGGGLAALYFAAFASSMLYHLIPQTMAFGLMALITAGACVAAMSVDSLLIALIGLLGGYLTPIVLSSGAKNLPGLFIYMAMLGVGLLFVARKRDWHLLNALSMVFTWTLYFLTLHKFYDKTQDYPVALAAGAAFFLIFSLIPLLYNFSRKKQSTALELVLLGVNSLAFFASAHAMATDLFPKERAAFISLALAAYNILFAWLLSFRKERDYALFCMLYAFAAFFVAFSAPLLLGSEWVTAAWALQALALLWLARRLKGRFLESLACVLYAVAAARLVFFDLSADFLSAYRHDFAASEYWKMAPARIGTFATFIISLGCAWLLLGKSEEAKRADKAEATPSVELQRQEPASMATLFLLSSIAALMVYLHFELRDFARAVMPSLSEPLLTAIWTAALAISLVQWVRVKSRLAAAFAAFFGIGLFVKLFLFDFLRLVFMDALRFQSGLDGLGMRLLDFAPALAILFAASSAASKMDSKRAGSLFCAGFLFSLFAYLTCEFKTMAHVFAPGFEAGAVSVFWGLFALGLLVSGIRKDIATFRVLGLILFLVTGLKIFLADLASLSQLARIAAFFGLGVATLAGAFVYMKFKGSFEKPEKSGDGDER